MHSSECFTGSLRNQHTHASEHLLTLVKKKVPGGNNSGSLATPGSPTLPHVARVSCRDLDVTHIMDSQAAGA